MGEATNESNLGLLFVVVCQTQSCIRMRGGLSIWFFKSEIRIAISFEVRMPKL